MMKRNILADRYGATPGDGAALAHALAPSLPASEPSAAAGKQTINVKFDDFGFGVGDIPNGYNHLDWQNINYYTGSIFYELFEGDSGYTRGIKSGENGATSLSGEMATITSGGGNFDFLSSYLTAAQRIGMTIDIHAYDDGVEKYHTTVTVSDDAPTAFNFGFKNVDTITFLGSGGTPDPDINGAGGTNIVFDNVKIAGKDGAIAGTLFDDRDGDGVQDAGEKGLKGRTVFDDANGNGALDTGEASTKTDRHGDYSLTVGFGHHHVAQIVPDGFTQTSPTGLAPDYSLAETTYKWTELSKVAGTELQFFSNDDDGTYIFTSAPISYWGQQSDSLFVSINGVLTLNGDLPFDEPNTALPNSGFPNGVIAPFWDDLSLSQPDKPAQAHIYALDDADHQRVIVEYKDMLVNDSLDTTVTFEVVIHYDGRIEFQYKALDDLGGSATVGIENNDGTDAAQYSYDTASLHDHLAIGFTPGTRVIPIDAEVDVDSGRTTAGVNFGSTATAAAAPITADAHGASGAALHWDHTLLAIA